MRILLAEDDPLLGDGLRAGLRQLGFLVDWVRDGQAAERELRAQPYAAAVLDLGLPLRDGMEVLAALRQDGIVVPVLVLTARDALPDRIRGLDIGADDYVIKPVDLHELAARLRALVRRSHGQPQETLTTQDVTLDPAARSVQQAGAPVVLSGREFDLLHALMLNAGRVLSREQLEQHLYSWGQEVDSNAIEVHIHHLRRKLGPALIQTVRGVGYMLLREAPQGMTLSPRSLQGRLLGLSLGLVVGVWLITAALTWIDVRHELDELLDGHLAQAAALLVVQQVGEIDEDDHAIDAPTLHRYAPKVAFQVFHEGELVLRSANAPAVAMVGLAEQFESGFRTVKIDAVDWRVFAARGAERDVQVYVGEQVGSRASILWAVLRSTLWPMVVALPLLALALGWAVHRGVSPLRRLGRTLASRQPQVLDPVVVDGAPTEMTPMIDALNGLFVRIGELMESERRFTADAAHELRTPISAIRMQAQVAQGEADEGLRRHALAATLEGCDRATRLVEQLLTLSRLEVGAAASGQPVALAGVIRSVASDLAVLAIQKQQSLEVDADAAGTARVRGDALLIAVLVRNLIDNAIRYSPPGGSVKVTLEGPSDRLRLTIDDSGPGMSEPDLQRLGERFFRVLGSGQGGSGLGWSIVRRIAAVHLATLEVGRSPTLGGLRVTVEWPGDA